MWQPWILSQWQKRGLLSWFARPFSWIYGTAIKIRRTLYRIGIKSTFRAPVPVVVVGNIYIGGTGKTPVILSLIEALRARGWHPGLVSRGYGSTSKKQAACGSGPVPAQSFGDEPAMISAKTGISVAVHASRTKAAKALLKFDPKVDLILSDDGLQHWALERDVELLIQDERAQGNGLVLPAGPLREPSRRLQEVDAILTRKPYSDVLASRIPNTVLNADFSVKVSLFLHLKTGQSLTIEQFKDQIANVTDVLAMAGIGVPQRFFNDLRELGVQTSRTLPLPDHAHINADWVAEQPERTILMTEKDAVRIAPLAMLDSDGLNPASLAQKSSTNDIDSRIWVGLAQTHWADQALFDWIDVKLRDQARPSGG